MGDIVKVRSPAGCAPFLKYTKGFRVIKLFKNAVKLNDGRIWNLNRIVKVSSGDKVDRPQRSNHDEEGKVSRETGPGNGPVISQQPGDKKADSGESVVLTRSSTRTSRVLKYMLDYYW